MNDDYNEFKVPADPLHHADGRWLSSIDVRFEKFLLFDANGNVTVETLSDEALIQIRAVLRLMGGVDGLDLPWDPATVEQSVEEELRRRGLL